VSGSIPSPCKSAFGRCSNVTGNPPARTRNGLGNAETVASTSADATAHNFSQFKFTLQRWRGRGRLATVTTDFFLALEWRRFMVV
jgi:hypothetical protein